MRRSLLVLAVLLVLPARGMAQQRAPGLVTARRPVLASEGAARGDSVPQASARIAGRAAYAVAGYTVAAAAGALAFAGINEACHCRLPTGTAMFIGAAAVGPLGSGHGAAIPDYGSPCTRPRRDRRAFEMAAVGTLAGAVLGSAMSSKAAVALTLPGSIVGAVAGAECRAR